MNAEEITVGLEAVSGAAGRTLSSEERAVLKCSLPILRANSKLARVQFWGKIIGTGSNYLIAKGIAGDSHLSRPSFYWSHDGIEWLQLVPLDKETTDLCRGLRGRFTGDPSFAYVVEVPLPPAEKKKKEIGDAAASGSVAVAPTIVLTVPKTDGRESDAEEDEDGASDADEDGEEGKPKKRVKKVTIVEEKRLTAVVCDIDENASVVPRGGLMLTAEHAVLDNPSFGGLALADSGKLSSFLHVRQPKVAQKRSMLEQAGLSKTLDFLDTLAEDVPKEMWSINVDKISGVAVVKSLLWQGSVAYAIAGTSHFGNVYLGTGEKSLDLAFIL